MHFINLFFYVKYKPSGERDFMPGTGVKVVGLALNLPSGSGFHFTSKSSSEGGQNTSTNKLPV